MEDKPTPTPALSEVAPGLWICAEAALPAALADSSLGITHLVSIGYPPPENPTGVPVPGGGGGDGGDEGGEGEGEGGGVSGVKVLRIELEDDDDGDLLTQIPTATAFISDGLRLRETNRAMAAAAVKDDATADAADTPPTGGGGGGGGGGGMGGVLVHCQAGVSRSAAVVVAHVMRTRGVDPDEALAIVRAAHPAADPNPGFRTQLALWHSMAGWMHHSLPGVRLVTCTTLAVINRCF
jgi:dual specificity phosphatase 12